MGAFVGVAAFFGALMNMNFLLAGSASTNPLLFLLAVGLILAWKVAGYFGVDRWLCRCSGPPGIREWWFRGGRSQNRRSQRRTAARAEPPAHLGRPALGAGLSTVSGAYDRPGMSGGRWGRTRSGVR